VNASLKQMLLAARAMVERAYAPYSGVKVGVCLRSASGKLYSGCNVENGVYPLGYCAEAGAITAMVAAGEQQIAELTVVANGDALCRPCGACLQRLQEFAMSDLSVHMCNAQGECESSTLAELLPKAFNINEHQK